MPVKLRTAKLRHPLMTDEAIELYRRGREIIEAGDHETWEEDGGCRAEYLTIGRRLDWGLLNVHPGDAGPLDIFEDGGGDGGSPIYRESIPRARELFAILERAIRK